jgi:hypothetical protein
MIKNFDFTLSLDTIHSTSQKFFRVSREHILFFISISIEENVMKSMTFRKIVIATILAMISSVCLAFTAGTNMPTVPPGWTLKDTYSNVLVYQKTGESTYMQVVDIKSGGRVAFFNQSATGASPYQFGINSMTTWWGMLQNKKTMVNGQFFAYMNIPPFQINPTTLSFGVKSNGNLLTPGADNTAYPATSMRQLEITSGVGATVLSWNQARLNPGGSPAQNIIVGLHPSPSVVTNKSPTANTGRMLMCTKPQSGAPWVYILSAASITQQAALTYANNWQCTESSTVMMDGSGSAQLQTVNSGLLLPGNRSLPQVIAIYSN